MQPKTAIVIFFILLVAVLITSCKEQADKAMAQFPPAGFIADLGTGYSLFHDKCSVCHGEKAMGSHQGPPLVHKIYEPSHHSDISFYWAVLRGVNQHHWGFGEMPPVPGLSPEDVGHIVAYVRSEQIKAGIR